MADLPYPGTARANRGNMAIRSDFNEKLSGMTLEEVREVFRAMRAVKDDSPMTVTTVYKKAKERIGVSATTCWDTGCTFPISSLAVIKQLKSDIIPLTQYLTIIEASGSELKM